VTSNYWRFVVAAALLIFAWKGSSLDLEWPPTDTNEVIPTPTPELLEWAEPMRAVLPKMLVKDRIYLSRFYDAMAFVLIRDTKREKRIVATTGDFVQFHAGSLQLAIDRGDVGKYTGLGEAIDETFINALGPEQRLMDDDDRAVLTAACTTLAYVLRVGGDE